MINANTAPDTPLPLEDIIPPSLIDFWPLALGWWLLLALVIALIVISVIAYRRYQKHWVYRKEALSLLQATLKQWQQKEFSDSVFYQHLFGIVKRTALTAYPEQNIASTYGDQWLTLLKKQAPDIKVDNTIIEAICFAQYQKTTEADSQSVYQFCEQWIKQHKSQWQGDIV